MDERITFKKPENVTREQAATLGVGMLVSPGGELSDVKNSDNGRRLPWDWSVVQISSSSRLRVRLARNGS